jgi:hypothetical protein
MKLILNAFQDKVKKTLSDKSKVKLLEIHIHKYFDANHEIIFSKGPGKKLFFTETVKEPVLGLFNIPVSDVKAVLSKVTEIQASWKKHNEPFVIVMVLAIREAVILKNIALTKLLISFLAFRFYAPARDRFFQYDPNEQVLNYTIENLTNKFKYKRLANNYEVMLEVAMQSHDTYTKELIECDDKIFVTYISQMENRIYKIIKTFAKEVYENIKNKRYLNLEKSSHDDTGEVREYDTSSKIISDLADTTSYEFFSKKINMGILNIVCNRNDISKTQLYQVLNCMKENETHESVTRLVSNSLSMIFEDDPKALSNICNTNFIVHAGRIISIKKTSKKELDEIKSTLDTFLMKYCSKYATTNREATRISYRNAVYSYLIYIMVLKRCH